MRRVGVWRVSGYFRFIVSQEYTEVHVYKLVEEGTMQLLNGFIPYLQLLQFLKIIKLQISILT